MRNITEFINEHLMLEDEIADLEKKLDKVEKKAEDAEKKAKDAEADAAAAEKEANKAEESIKSEEDFKDYAKNKFEEVFGDDVDEDKMNGVIDGILKKYAEDAENGNWGKLVGVLNKSFGH